MRECLQCRLCAEFATKHALINIDNVAAQNLNLKHKIKECFNLDFHEIHLPKNVCLPCCEKVDIFFGFKEQVNKVQKTFQTLANKKSNIKDEISDFNVEPLEYVESVLNDDTQIKENLQESACKNGVDKNNKSNISKEDTVSKEKETVTSESEKTKEKKGIRWRTPKRSELDPELAIDSAERSEIIRRVQEEWKSYKWKCCICNEEFQSVDDLRTHFTKVHNKNPQYSCMECSKVYISYHSFKRHHRTHRKEYNYRCHICSRFFYLKKKYEIHLEKHDLSKNSENEKKYICAICGKDYKSSASLGGHLRTIHGGKREFKCEICNKILASRAKFHHHKKAHKGGRNFTCDQCGKNYSEAANLKYHMSTAHSDSKPYCCPHCQKTFKLERLLKIHLIVHDDKKHVCEICGTRFQRKETLRKHSSIHTGVLAFECEFCKKKFRTKPLLKVHRRQHTGERPYSCVECNHFFTDSANYIKHMKGKHGGYKTKKNDTHQTNPTLIKSVFPLSIQPINTTTENQNLLPSTTSSVITKL